LSLKGIRHIKPPYKVTITKSHMYPPEYLQTHFKNVTNGKRVVKELLANFVLDAPFDNPLLYSLIQHHPRCQEKKTNQVKAFVKRKRPPYNTESLYIIYDDEEDDISYIQCLEGLFGKHKPAIRAIDNITNAFREAVCDGTKQTYLFKTTSNGNGQCCLCDTTSKVHVDHYPTPFSHLLTTFLTQEQQELDRIEIIKVGNRHIIADGEIRKRWSQFHDKHAKYRILCGSCNSKMGAYGYKEAASTKSKNNV